MALPPAGSPTALGEHPRLHVTGSTLSALRQKVEGYYTSEFQSLISMADSLYTNLQKPNGYQGWPVDILAFVGMVGEVTGVNFPTYTALQYKQKALAYCEDLVDGVLNPGTIQSGSGYYPCSTTQCVARAFDWAYDAATTAQKAKIAGWLADRVPTAISVRQGDIGLFSSPFAEREAAWYIAAAIWGESELTSTQQTYAQNGVDDFTAEMINSGDGRLVGMQFVARQNGGYSEIGAYDNHQRRLLLELDGWRTSMGQDYGSIDAWPGYPAAWLPGIPRLAAYLLQPYPNYRTLLLGQRDGDSKGLDDLAYSCHLARVVGWSSGLNAASGHTDMAGLARWLVELGEAETGDYTYAYWMWIVFGQKASVLSPDDLTLPNYCHFEGLGIYSIRTGWTDEKDTVLAICGYPTIYYGHAWGPLAHDRPRGFHLSKYGPLIHTREGYLRSASGQRQCEVLFTDPNSTRQSLWDDSRNYGSNDTGVSSYLDNTGRFVEGIKRKKSTDYFHHVFVQHKDAYVSAVKNYGRGYVFVPGASTDKPDYLFVMDRTETQESDDATPADEIRKRWSIGCSWRPACNGTETILVGATNPYGPNVAEYDGHSGDAEVVITNQPPGGDGVPVGKDPYALDGDDPDGHTAYPLARGKAIVTCLEPSAVKVSVRGGPGQYGYSDFREGYEFWDDGVGGTSTPYVPPTGADGYSSPDNKTDDYQALKRRTGGGMFCGTFCVEIEPETNAAVLNFLNVIQVGHDTDTKRTVNTITDPTNGWIGGHIEDAVEGDLVVLFADTETDGATRRSTFSYSITSSGPSVLVRHIIVDMEPGTYAVTKDGQVFEAEVEVDENGVLSWTSIGGSTWSAYQVTPTLARKISTRGLRGAQPYYRVLRLQSVQDSGVGADTVSATETTAPVAPSDSGAGTDTLDALVRINLEVAASAAAPCQVWLDATESWFADFSDPWTRVRGKVDWGDGHAGTWRTTGKNRNLDYGIKVQHLYKVPGVYLPTMTLEDETTGRTWTQTFLVSVTTPELVWPVADRVVYAVDGDFTGAPEAGSYRTLDGVAYDWADVLADCTAGKWVQIKRGGTVEATGVYELGASISGTDPWMISAWGSGALAKPVVEVTERYGIFLMPASDGSEAPTDWRIQNIRFEVPTPAFGQNIYGIGHLTNDASQDDTRWTDIRLPNWGVLDSCEWDGFTTAIGFDVQEDDCQGRAPHHIVVHECDGWRAWGSAPGSGGYIVFAKWDMCALDGCHFEDTSNGEHVVRVQHAHRTLIRHTEAWYAEPSKGCLTLRTEYQDEALAGGKWAGITETPVDARYCLIQECDVRMSVGQQIGISISPKGGASRALFQDIVVENTVIRSHASTTIPPYLIGVTSGLRVTLRNVTGIIPHTGGTNARLVSIYDSNGQTAYGTAPDYVSVIGCSCYYKGTGQVIGVIVNDTSASWQPHVKVRAIVLHAPNGSYLETWNPSDTNTIWDVGDNRSSGSGDAAPGWVDTNPTEPEDMAIASAADTTLRDQVVTPIPELHQDYLRQDRLDGTLDIGAFEWAATRTVSVIDSGSANDAAALGFDTATRTVEDAGAGSEAASPVASVGVSDSGAGSDTIDIVSDAMIQVLDSGTGTDDLVAAVTLSLADSATGADVLTVLGSAAKSVFDSGVAIDDLASVSAAIVASESASGADAPRVVAELSLAELATGVDSVALQTVYGQVYFEVKVILHLRREVRVRM